jgi:hypothetical protein
MSMTNSPEHQDTSLTRDLLYAARYYLGGRRGVIALAAIALVAGFAFNWSWLVAAGIAPLLLGVLPCVAMCALGLCMNKMVGRSCSTGAASDNKAELADEKRTPETLEQGPINLLESPAEEIRTEVIIPASQQPLSAEERRKTDA